MPSYYKAAIAVITALLCACGEDTQVIINAGTEPEQAKLLPRPPPGSPLLPGVWLAGDLHVHDDHSSDGSLPRQTTDDRGPGNTGIKDQILFSNTSGLDFLPLTDHRTYDQHYDPLWESANLLLIPGEEANGSPHATVQGAVDTIVQGANPPNTPNFVNLQQSIWEAHAQDANWVTAHPDDGEINDDGSPNARASAQGIDLVEVWNRGSDIDKEIAYAEGRWNARYRFGVAGASDNHFKEIWAQAGPGMPTTWVFAAEQRERAVVDGLRAGRTTLSSDMTAPTLTLQADFNGDGAYEAMGGDEVFAPAGTRGRLRLDVRRGPNTTVIVYKSPGLARAPIAKIQTGVLNTNATFFVDVVAESAPTWYRAVVRGTGLPSHYDISSIPGSLIPTPQELPNQLRAMTSPIFVSPAPVHAQPEIPVPADLGTADGAALTLGLNGEFMGFPDVAVIGTTMHVVAESHAAGRSQIWYRRRVNGNWQAAVSLTPGAKAARFAKVAARGSDVWVAWQNNYLDELPHRPAIYLRRSSDGGATWSAEQLVRSVAGRCEHPALAITADGRPIVAWQEITAGHPFDVMAQILGRDAAPVNVSRDNQNLKQVLPALPTDTRSSRYPASVWPTVAVAPDGRIAVGWQDNRSDPDPLWTGQIQVGEGTDPDNWQIMVRLRGPGSVNWNLPSTLGRDEHADRHPSLAFASDGSLTAAWTAKEQRSSGANVAVLSSRTIDGFNWSAPTGIGFNANAMSLWPRLTRAADGRVRAAWHDSRSADWRWRVITAKQAANGTWGSVQMFPSRGINTWPALSGNGVVFASTRNAARLQRDRTHQIFAIDLP